MKKLTFLFFALLAMSTYAQQMKTYACGTITYRDGREETYEKVELTCRWQKKIIVKGGTIKKRMTIPAKDIQCITYWPKKKLKKQVQSFVCRC